MDDTQPRAALVTAATGSLGSAVAVELARRGWSLFCQHFGTGAEADEVEQALHGAARQHQQRIETAWAKADVSCSEGREQLVEQVLDEFSRVDLLVNADAGSVGVTEDLLEITEDTFAGVLTSGVTAALFLTKLVASEMVRLVEAGEMESGKIVTINSISAYTTSVDRAAHCINRAAVAMMTKLFADRLGEHGINVYEVRAGILSSGAADPAHARYDKLIEDGLTPIRRWGRPGDVARAVAAVAEDLLSFSTGEVINVDGGFHLRRL